ncbi:MAG: 2-C-methyl-D-erythritol 4-phosphate cytidylyltransferase [Bacteroidales bacterium]|nr:2-C-methyl-D-erythritol 4-phosphate cytidylyltransferase [Bacteroidales bacterium]
MVMQCLSSNKNYIIVVAGGLGLRLKSDIPKQFLPICGKPILMRTLERIRQFSNDINIILVLPKQHQNYWQLLCREYGFDIKHKIVDGGKERFYSVKNALDTIDINEDAIVGVHDGVRPLVSLRVLGECYETARIKGSAIPAVNPVESIRFGKEDIKNDVKTISYNRDLVWLVQTPQCFELKRLKQAYNQPFNKRFTDDASVVESIGYRVDLVEGNRENIKITNSIDIAYAELLLNDFKD